MYSDKMKGLFSPLDKKYCMYFYYLSFISFCFMLFSIIGLILLLTEYQKNKYMIASNISTIFMLGIGYFSNRLLYTMCIR
jgi:hypothetical protein